MGQVLDHLPFAQGYATFEKSSVMTAFKVAQWRPIQLLDLD
ncbi:hypothetical protein [Oleiagrimonas sp.]|nr:hypothetical protein [Oleiagrimonas sp.]